MEPTREAARSDAPSVPPGAAAMPVEPTPEELAVLSGIERFAFRLVHRMNQGGWKLFWTWCQSVIGASWIRLATYNLMQVYGLDHLNLITPDRPLLLVANHRSFFDMYVVSSLLFRHVRWRIRLFFPVRGHFFYDSIRGLLVNWIMGWWSMYPPVFTAPEKRIFDKYSLRKLTELCRTGRGHIIGFHPEGKRNLNSDPYSYLRAQPGVGKVIADSAPQVIPVFIAGLGNDLWRQVISNWRGGEAIRVHFGAPLDLAPYLSKRATLRTHKEIADFVMSRIADLGEEDRQQQSSKAIAGD